MAMNELHTVLITGAAGNLGSKLRRHLAGRFALRLLDVDARGDSEIVQADLVHWTEGWVRWFRGVDTVVHLAADATAQLGWPRVVEPNMDAMIHVYQAAVQQGVRRVIFASSNHVMGGYKDTSEPALLAPTTPPMPGAHYVVQGEARDSTPYGAAKLFGERLGKAFAEVHGLSVIALRIGWVQRGENRSSDIPPDRGDWFRLMWLSDRDYCQLLEKCITAQFSVPFVVLNGMSANTGMRWDISETRRLLGYEPKDDVTRP